METIPYYDEWKTTPQDERPVTHCAICGTEMYEGDVLYTIDGGICKKCLNKNYKQYVSAED